VDQHDESAGAEEIRQLLSGTGSTSNLGHCHQEPNGFFVEHAMPAAP
jgi:hypothetical protein